MPFEPGKEANKAGRPRKGTSLRELLRNHPIKDKRLLVVKAYELALGGSVQWAEWIARHGDDGIQETQIPEGASLREITIREIIVERPALATPIDVIVDDASSEES